MRDFKAYKHEFDELLTLVLKHHRYLTLKSESTLSLAVEHRAIVEYKDNPHLELADILNIIEAIVDGHIASDEAARKIRQNRRALPGAEAREKIRSALESSVSVSRKELDDARRESDDRIVKLCEEYKITEEQLFVGLTYLDTLHPINWHPIRVVKNRKLRPWLIEKLVFRYYLAGIPMGQIPTRIKAEFSELGATVEVPDQHESLANVVMAIRAIPTLLVAALLLLISAAWAGAAKIAAKGNAHAACSWANISAAAAQSLATLAIAAALVTLPIWMSPRKCNSDRSAQKMSTENSRVPSEDRKELRSRTIAHTPGRDAKVAVAAMSNTPSLSATITPTTQPNVERSDRKRFSLDEFEVWLYQDDPVVTLSMRVYLRETRGDLFMCIDRQILPPGLVQVAVLFDSTFNGEVVFDEVEPEHAWPESVRACMAEKLRGNHYVLMKASSERKTKHSLSFVLSFFAGLSESEMSAQTQRLGFENPVFLAPLPNTPIEYSPDSVP